MYKRQNLQRVVKEFALAPLQTWSVLDGAPSSAALCKRLSASGVDARLLSPNRNILEVGGSAVVLPIDLPYELSKGALEVLAGARNLAVFAGGEEIDQEERYFLELQFTGVIDVLVPSDLEALHDAR